MARTKQTARLSVGGRAPKKQLEFILSKIKPTSEKKKVSSRENITQISYDSEIKASGEDFNVEEEIVVENESIDQEEKEKNKSEQNKSNVVGKQSDANNKKNSSDVEKILNDDLHSLDNESDDDLDEKILNLKPRRFKPGTLRRPRTNPSIINGVSGGNKGVIAMKRPRNKILKKRKNPGTKVLRDIKRLQKSTSLEIQRAPFRRFINGIFCDNGCYKGVMYGKGSLSLLQEIAESYLVDLYGCSKMCTENRSRKTSNGNDVNLVLRIRDMSQK